MLDPPSTPQQATSLSGPGLAGLSVAVVHYWLVTWRGGEKVLKAILDLFPEADIYTLFHDPGLCARELPGRTVYGSAFDWPGLRSHYPKMFPLYPAAIRSLRLKRKYDLVISSESGPAKGIQIPEGVPHLSYVHTPMRYCWDNVDPYLASVPKWARRAVAWRFEKLREWDETTVSNVDRFVANSQNVASRISNYYHRDAAVCTPPIDPALLDPDYPKYRVQHSRRPHYLSFGALTPYKKIDFLIEAFRSMPDRELLVVGEGVERSRLERMAGSNVRFLGGVPWEALHPHILSSRALVVPGEEDFGMIPPEVMAHGTPVIAYGKGGVLETVLDGADNPAQGTGLFFREQTTESLIDAVARFEAMEDHFQPHFIQNHAREFSMDRFKMGFQHEVQTLLREGRNG